MTGSAWAPLGRQHPREVRIQIAVRAASETQATWFGDQVEALHTNLQLAAAETHTTPRQ